MPFHRAHYPARYDPLVLVHARALLANSSSEGVTTYVHADYHDPEKILAEAAEVLDFDRPVAVMFMGVLGYEPDLDVVRSITGRVMDAVPSGSHLVLWDGTDTSQAVVDGADRLTQSGGVLYVLRSPGVPVPEIACKLVVPSGKNKGQHPSVATVNRNLAEDDAPRPPPGPRSATCRLGAAPEDDLAVDAGGGGGQ